MKRHRADEKQQASSIADAVMAPAKQEQARRAARLQTRRPGPYWTISGLGLAGAGLGSAMGSGEGSGILYGAIGLAAGAGLGVLVARMRR